MAAVSSSRFPKRRELPKLMACMTKGSLENMRNKALFCMDILDAKGIRRRKIPLHECLILELREAGFVESADYFEDLIYDNIQIVAEDDIGIVVDLRKRNDYLEHIAEQLQIAEKQRDKGETKKECMYLLELALDYAEKGKGILWLAEKFYLAAIAVGSQYLIDGGRQKACCKYHYAKFLLDKFPGADTEEPYHILTEVRDSSIGKSWLLFERRVSGGDGSEELPPDTLFQATAIQLHRVLLKEARAILKSDPGKAERLSRLAERRAKDAHETDKTAEAIIEIGICQLAMNNLNNAQKTFERALKIHTESNNIEGLCDSKMHMAAVMQRLGDHEAAAKLLTDMGAMAMEYGLRRHLGRALHLLGELHLRSERPELGTQHLQEAFRCFMGTNWNFEPTSIEIARDSKLDFIYKEDTKEIFEEEAEQSRLMMAISAGQERMASYFNLLRESSRCAVAQMKTIEWKLSNSSWWIKRNHHDFLPCMCPVHNRSPLDVLKLRLHVRSASKKLDEESLADNLHREGTTQDIQKLRSSFGHASSKEVQSLQKVQ